MSNIFEKAQKNVKHFNAKQNAEEELKFKSNITYINTCILRFSEQGKTELKVSFNTSEKDRTIKIAEYLKNENFTVNISTKNQLDILTISWEANKASDSNTEKNYQLKEEFKDNLDILIISLEANKTSDKSDQLKEESKDNLEDSADIETFSYDTNNYFNWLSIISTKLFNANLYNKTKYEICFVNVNTKTQYNEICSIYTTFVHCGFNVTLKKKGSERSESINILNDNITSTSFILSFDMAELFADKKIKEFLFKELKFYSNFYNKPVKIQDFNIQPQSKQMYYCTCANCTGQKPQ